LDSARIKKIIFLANSYSRDEEQQIHLLDERDGLVSLSTSGFSLKILLDPSFKFKYFANKGNICHFLFCRRNQRADSAVALARLSQEQSGRQHR
jgi:hypothetical protein